MHHCIFTPQNFFGLLITFIFIYLFFTAAHFPEQIGAHPN